MDRFLETNVEEEKYSAKYEMLLKALENFFDTNVLFERDGDIKNIYQMFLLGVHKDYRRNGLAGALVDKSFKVNVESN